MTGRVEWQYQRLFATNGVRHLLGVSRVSDQVIINPTVSVTRVKSPVDAALNLMTVADPPDISVDVNDTVVTLSGTILSWDERDSAMNLAWGTPIVHSVIDRLKIVP